jgi:hypothetical protein
VKHHPKWKNDFINNNVYPDRAQLGINGMMDFSIDGNMKYSTRLLKMLHSIKLSIVHMKSLSKCTRMCTSYLQVDDGYAERMIHPKYYNSLGKECGKDDIDRFGELVDITFKHPELVFVADECGTNTNMSKENMSSGNKKHASTRDADVKIPACTSDCHFTTMIWTALTGEPVMVVVITEKDSDLTWSELHGFNIEAKWVGDDSIYNDIKSSDDSTAALKDALKTSIFPEVLLNMNTGPGKVFPGGPVCSFQGCSIP